MPLSLAQHLKQNQPPPPGGLNKPGIVKRNITDGSDISENTYSMASSIRSSFKMTGKCTFTPSDAFSEEENAILLKLSEELMGLRQDDIMSIVEEFTLATASNNTLPSTNINRRNSSQGTLERISVTSIPIFEEEDHNDLEEYDDEEEEMGPKDDKKLLDLLEELRLEVEDDRKEEEGKRRQRRGKRRSTLLDMLGGKRQSTLQEMWQKGTETWKNNVDTILAGEWTGQLLLQEEEDDDNDFGNLSASDNENEED